MIEPARTDRNAIDLAMDWASGVDERDLSDAALEWADHDCELVAFPESVGELKAMLQVAFDAGRIYQLRLAAKRAGDDTERNAEAS